MKIINVTPGLIQIPPNGWGAVEKIIWEFHNNLLALGHDSHITYLDDVPTDAEIVHIHVANLALMARERGIPYYFTMHDHHAFLYGKESAVYKENLEAMKHSIKSFVPAKYLVDYFDGIPEYFSHGVNTTFFAPSKSGLKHKLLCVANNGYAHDQASDRKGFGIAIDAARELDLPITIAGPMNNKQYFDKYPPTYNKLTIVYDPTEEELLKLYRNHTIFVHPSEMEAGHPNLTLLEAMACGLPVVGTFEGGHQLEGMIVADRNVHSVTAGISTVMYEYQRYKLEAISQANRLSWKERTKALLDIYTNIWGWTYTHTEHSTMKDKLLHHYVTTKKEHHILKPNVIINAVNGMFIEIRGEVPKKYRVRFINKDTGKIEYETEIGNNCWARTSIQYYVDWKVEVVDLATGNVFDYELPLRDTNVYIALDSRSLGDTLAWMPYVEEFRRKHNCTVICSTFWNQLFDSEYPDIQFVPPGETVYNLSAMYVIGLFFVKDSEVDFNKNRTSPLSTSLQQISADILGIPYKEIRPKIKMSPVALQRKKQISIAVHSTTQAKYWNNPTGWQTVVNWLNNRGYSVRLLSHEPDGYMGNKNPKGVIQHPPGPIEMVVDELKASELFLGIGSGLSWLSWALEVPTVIISGFSEAITEVQNCIRIASPPKTCAGCYNRYRLDAGDWNWCPDQKGTPRQFECSKSITAEMVIRELEKIL